MNNDISESYCSFEHSMILKEKGFTVPCDRYHNLDENGQKKEDEPIRVAPFNYNHPPYNLVSIPTHGIVYKWLWVNFRIMLNIHGSNCSPGSFKPGYERDWILSYYILILKNNKFISRIMVDGFADDPEEVFNKALGKILKELI